MASCWRSTTANFSYSAHCWYRTHIQSVILLHFLLHYRYITLLSTSYQNNWHPISICLHASDFLVCTLVMMPRLAPWSSSAAATSRCPSLAARCKGVYPELVVASGHAPFASSCWTMSCLPRRLEMCSGVWSSWWHQTNKAFLTDTKTIQQLREK